MSNNNKNGGVGFFSLLTVLFIGLKLTGYITWSWWWVLCPLWASFAVAILFALFAFLIAILVAIIKSI